MSRGSQPAEPEWLARPSESCCLKGYLHSGEPKGTVERLADVDTYVTKPDASKDNGHVVFYFPDVFGFFTNALLVCDQYAEFGYTVAAMDCFNGDPVYMHRDGPKQPHTGFDFDGWLDKSHEFTRNHIDAWIDAAKQKYGSSTTKYACVGYCFGAPYVMDAISGSSPTCEVGAFAHPAFLKEEHFEKITRPLYLSCAENDFTFNTQSRDKGLKILREAKKPYGLQLFSGVEHGFALRCDLSKSYERWCKEQSVKGIVDYFDLQLGIWEK